MILGDDLVKILGVKPYQLRLITISGDYGTGKDTYAKILKDSTGGKIVRFADPIREIFAEFGINGDALDLVKRTPLVFPCDSFINNIEVSGLTVRGAMIEVAEKAKQSNPSIWADILVKRLNQTEIPQTYIIPDLRFSVEVEALAKLKPLWIHLEIEKVNDFPLEVPADFKVNLNRI